MADHARHQGRREWRRQPSAAQGPKEDAREGADARCCAEQPCMPGDTELCGPDTPYPDTLKKCLVSQGVPYWFDGDCYT